MKTIQRKLKILKERVVKKKKKTNKNKKKKKKYFYISECLLGCRVS